MQGRLLISLAFQTLLLLETCVYWRPAFIDFTCLPDPATIRDLHLLEALHLLISLAFQTLLLLETCVYWRPAFIDFTIILSYRLYRLSNKASLMMKSGIWKTERHFFSSRFQTTRVYIINVFEVQI